MWRTLGYIPEVWAKRCRGRRIFVNSGHKDAEEMQRHAFEVDSGNGMSGGAVPAQDLHTILVLIWERSMLPMMQKQGFRWDLFYNGKL